MSEQLDRTRGLDAIDGTSRQRIFMADGLAWGAAIAGEAGAIVAAVGPPFAPGSEEVDSWSFGLDGQNVPPSWEADEC